MSNRYGNHYAAKSVAVFNLNDKLIHVYDSEIRMAEDTNINYNTVRTWFKRHYGRFYYNKKVYDINNTSNNITTNNTDY